MNPSPAICPACPLEEMKSALAITVSLLLGITVLPVLLAGGDTEPPTCGQPTASSGPVPDTTNSSAVANTVGCLPGGIAPLGGEWSLPGPRELIDRNPGVLNASHHDYPAWDWLIPQGTPVYAVRGGRVDVVRTWPYNWWQFGCHTNGENGCSTCGVGITVVDEQGARWTYCHGSAVLPKVGDHIHAGQLILRSGNTGRSGTPHLHIEIRVDGEPRCPQPLLRSLYEHSLGIDPTSLPVGGCSF